MVTAVMAGTEAELHRPTTSAWTPVETSDVGAVDVLTRRHRRLLAGARRPLSRQRRPCVTVQFRRVSESTKPGRAYFIL